MIVDYLGQRFFTYPRNCRIVSLVPSITELIAYLGLSNQLVGRTKFCVFPEYLKAQIPSCGGTKNPNLKKIASLRPDIVIANYEENRLEDVMSLKEMGIDVFVTKVCDLQDNDFLIHSVGYLFSKEIESNNLIQIIKTNQAKYPKIEKGNALYLIWKDPYLSVGGDTFIHSMLLLAGFKNVFDQKTRYPEVKTETLAQSDIDHVLLSSEPFPFGKKHISQVARDLYIDQEKILLVDGTYFSWYGSRISLAPRYLYNLVDNPPHY